MRALSKSAWSWTLRPTYPPSRRPRSFAQRRLMKAFRSNMPPARPEVAELAMQRRESPFIRQAAVSLWCGGTSGKWWCATGGEDRRQWRLGLFDKRFGGYLQGWHAATAWKLPWHPWHPWHHAQIPQKLAGMSSEDRLSNPVEPCRTLVPGYHTSSVTCSSLKWASSCAGRDETVCRPG